MIKPIIKSFSLASLLVFAFTNYSQGQIFGKVLDKTADIFVDKLEEDLTNKLAQTLAERAYRPVGNAFDSLWQTNLPKDPNTGEVDWGKANADYAAMFGQFDATDQVPESYQLDVKLRGETKDYDGEVHENIMYFSKEGSAFAIEDESNMVLLDPLKDIIVMYDLKNGTAQAIKGMMTMGSNYMPQVETDTKPMVIKKTGKKKKIINYVSEEYKGEDEEEKVKFYLSTAFPVSWHDAFGPFLQKFAAQVYQDNMDEWEGMVLKSETEVKGTKKKTSYEAKEVDLEGMTINKADYEFKPLGQE